LSNDSPTEQQFTKLLNIIVNFMNKSGADPGFQVRGGALKKIAPSGGRRENFWGISCEKSRFYAKKSYFFQLPMEARKFLEYFV
jgi:hypothetical protein